MNICIFTGTRAEYGLLKPIMDRINKDPDLQLMLIVSGTHLSERHGHTIEAILEDGFIPDACIPLPLEDDTPTGVAHATGVAVSEYAKALSVLAPDVLILLGDRYETFACSTAAAITRTPIAHLHGGETTEGAVDEYFRHAITKMSHLHFASCEKYRKRIIQLGEHPDTVFNVGAIGIENIKNLNLMEKEALESSIGFRMGTACLLATFHPVTLDTNGTTQVDAFFDGLDMALAENPALTVILTGANADSGGSAIDIKATTLANRLPGRVHITPSLGLLRYLSAMKHCAAVVGNSSSGIIEAPSFHVPTVNIGNRQKGREQAESVFDCEPEPLAIATAISHALSHAGRTVAKHSRSPYEKYGTSRRILEEIKKTRFNTIKPFYDIPFRLNEGEGKE